MNKVLVLDKNRVPLMPCHPARARKLLDKGRAKVLRYFPFTIIVDREGGETQDVQVKLDPGSKVTGLAVVVDGQKGKKVVFAAEITHRGDWIKKRLDARASLRGNRRFRKTRYRQCRHSNRKNMKGKLRPSVQSRIYNIETWVNRLSRVIPINSASMEDVKFDTQKMQNPEISGVEYRKGTLWGYEMKEYLLQKWKYKCAYCGARDIPLQVEHIIPSSRGGSDRVINLTLACRPCNQHKGSKTAAEFGFPKILEKGVQCLKAAGHMNSMRPFVRRTLEKMLPLETGTGGQTKFNRCSQKLPKEHWLDAACVGYSGAKVFIPKGMIPLRIKAMGHGQRQMCQTDRFGFPNKYRQRVKMRNGFQTGDIVRDTLNNNVGRVITTARPYCLIGGKKPHFKHLIKLQSSDGYSYDF